MAQRVINREDERLSIDDEAHLRVVALRVKEAVAISSNASGTVNDGLAEAPGWIEAGHFQ